FGSIQTGMFMTNTSGLYYNLYDLDLDFTLDGWNMDYINQVSCKDNNGVLKLYSFDADFNLVGYRSIWTLCMNLDLYNQNFTESIFDIVANKQWTLDKMIELCSVFKDNTGDQEMKVGEDTYGLLTTTHNAFGMIAAAGIRLSQNVDGVITTNVDLMKANNAIDAVDKMIELYQLDGVKADNGYTSNQTELENGRTLFIGEVFDILERMKDSEVNAVCLPEPLFSSEQDGYYSNVNTKDSLWVVSKNACNGNIDAISDFLNVFVYHSNKIVLPAFIATYGGIYCQDQRATELVEAVMSHRVYDMGYHPGGIYGLISTIVTEGNNNYSTAATKWANRTLGPVISDFVTKLTQN
ncbi:MAG: hypothetical protein MJ236_01565, partial [Clostridia bacterium]|nr:hypothetical protein [Clostridia bacterium]